MQAAYALKSITAFSVVTIVSAPIFNDIDSITNILILCGRQDNWGIIYPDF